MGAKGLFALPKSQKKVLNHSTEDFAIIHKVHAFPPKG
jgi:hypothetical protein